MLDRSQYKNKHERLGLKPLPDEPETEEVFPTLMHVGISAPTYSSSAMLEGWRRNGYMPRFLNYQGLKFDVGIEGLRERVIVKGITEKPDLIFLHIQNGSVFDPETLKQLSAIAPTINYTFDVRDNEKSKWLSEWAKFIDFSFVACAEDANDINKEIGKEVAFVLQSSADFGFFRPIDRKIECPKITFQGNNYSQSNLGFELAQERQDMINFLYKNYGSDFGAYGIGQQNKGTNIHQEIELYASSEIVINHNNFQRTFYTSDRIWRAMASGAFVLTKWFSGIDTFFEKGNHLDWWETFDELKGLIDIYLNQPLLRAAIAKSGCDAVRDRHSWTKRMQLVLELIKK